MCCKPHGKRKRALALRRRCGERSCDWQPRVASSERKIAVSPNQQTLLTSPPGEANGRWTQKACHPIKRKSLRIRQTCIYETVLCTTKPRMGRSSLRSARDVVARNRIVASFSCSCALMISINRVTVSRMMGRQLQRAKSLTTTAVLTNVCVFPDIICAMSIFSCSTQDLAAP